jgi:hypothetical protein
VKGRGQTDAAAGWRSLPGRLPSFLGAGYYAERKFHKSAQGCDAAENRYDTDEFYQEKGVM